MAWNKMILRKMKARKVPKPSRRVIPYAKAQLLLHLVVAALFFQ